MFDKIFNSLYNSCQKLKSFVLSSKNQNKLLLDKIGQEVEIELINKDLKGNFLKYFRFY